MLQRVLSPIYVLTGFALALFILMHIARKDDVGASFGGVVFVLYLGLLYFTQRAPKPRAKQASRKASP